MHTGIKQLAYNRFVDPQALLDFALANRETYHIKVAEEETTKVEDALVGTWYVNDLMDAFKAHLGDDYTAHRQKHVDQRMKSNPADPLTVLEQVGGKILRDIDNFQRENEKTLSEMVDKVRNDYGLYGEWISECLSDFTTHLAAKVMPVYDKSYIEFWPKVDQWVYENVYKKGSPAILSAMSLDRGVDGIKQVQEVMERLGNDTLTPKI